jgi:hypothetical protein
MIGTARPARRVAAGMAACLIPNENPCLFAGTSRASERCVAGCATALARPPSTRHATSPAQDPAKRATPSSATAFPIAETRIARCAPILSTTRPMTTEASEAVTKKTATANPSAADPKSISERIWTASPPVRNAGSTPAVAMATASSTGR